MNYDKSLLESIYEWALRDTDMHIISDEMYCHSQLTGAKPEFVSALALTATQSAPERVHVVWGFAKDFGLSGFRTGFVISKSKHVHSAMLGSAPERRTALSWFTPFDSLKHFYIQHLLAAEDGKFWDNAMRGYAGALTGSFTAVAEVLNKYKILFVHPKDANSAQFFWLDLRKFLPKTTTHDSVSVLFDSRSPDKPDPEQYLAQRIFEKAGVKILTGTTLTCKWPGYFRLCFTAFEKRPSSMQPRRCVNT